MVAWAEILVNPTGTLGIDTKPLLAGVGITGFTVGFALKVRVYFYWMRGPAPTRRSLSEAGPSVVLAAGCFRTLPATTCRARSCS